MEKVNKRQEQAQSTRQRIYDVASQLIADRGFDNVTVDEICEAAGVAKGGFYHHFPSKDELVIETYRLIDGRFTEALSHLSSPISPRDGILFTAGFMAMIAGEKGSGFCRQIYRSQLERGTDFFVSPERPFYNQIHLYLTKALENQALSSTLKIQDLTRMILTTARGVIYDWSLVRGQYPIEMVMKQTIGALLDGLLSNKIG